MAISKTDILTGTNTFICDVSKTADDDRTLVVAHGLTQNGAPVAPKKIAITSLAKNAANNIIASMAYWNITDISTVNVTLAAATLNGTGVASPQIRLTLEVPQTTTI